MIKCKIRNNVFETNSSSMHSIVVSKNKINYEDRNWEHFLYQLSDLDDMDYEGLTEDGKRILNLCITNQEYEGYYGRAPFGILSTFKEKLCYAIASLCNKEEDFEEKIVPVIKEVIKRAIDSANNSGGIINEYRKYDVIRIVNGYGNVCDQEFGYVDHQSQGLLENFLAQEQISLFDFLVDSRYLILIDGDEYCITDTLLDSFGTNNIKKIYGGVTKDF